MERESKSGRPYDISLGRIGEHEGPAVVPARGVVGDASPEDDGRTRARRLNSIIYEHDLGYRSSAWARCRSLDVAVVPRGDPSDEEEPVGDAYHGSELFYVDRARILYCKLDWSGSPGVRVDEVGGARCRSRIE